MQSPASLFKNYNDCVVTNDPLKLAKINLIVQESEIFIDRYKEVETKARVPWQVIAAIHYRESGQNFSTHLHNGDPLTARTVHVPKGRPLIGEPPFTWFESACDVLNGRPKPMKWSVGDCLTFLERYNGLGYSVRNIMTPYLWSYTDKYTGGLFTSDGIFDPDRIDPRPGCVVILKSFQERGLINDTSNLLSDES